MSFNPNSAEPLAALREELRSARMTTPQAMGDVLTETYLLVHSQHPLRRQESTACWNRARSSTQRLRCWSWNFRNGSFGASSTTMASGIARFRDGYGCRLSSTIWPRQATRFCRWRWYARFWKLTVSTWPFVKPRGNPCRRFLSRRARPYAAITSVDRCTCHDASHQPANAAA